MKQEGLGTRPLSYLIQSTKKRLFLSLYVKQLSEGMKES